jgi:hypothetical protein
MWGETLSDRPTTPDVAASANGAIIGNKKSKIYHRPDCPGAAKVSPQDRVRFRLKRKHKRLVSVGGELSLRQRKVRFCCCDQRLRLPGTRADRLVNASAVGNVNYIIFETKILLLYIYALVFYKTESMLLCGDPYVPRLLQSA